MVCGSDARDRLLYALGRLLDAMVDTLALNSKDEGLSTTPRDGTTRTELQDKLDELRSDCKDDACAIRMVRRTMSLCFDAVG